LNVIIIILSPIFSFFIFSFFFFNIFFLFRKLLYQNFIQSFCFLWGFISPLLAYLGMIEITAVTTMMNISLFMLIYIFYTEPPAKLSNFS
jgi:hypothetical protein